MQNRIHQHEEAVRDRRDDGRGEDGASDRVAAEPGRAAGSPDAERDQRDAGHQRPVLLGRRRKADEKPESRAASEKRGTMRVPRGRDPPCEVPEAPQRERHHRHVGERPRPVEAYDRVVMKDGDRDETADDAADARRHEEERGGGRRRKPWDEPPAGAQHLRAGNLPACGVPCVVVQPVVLVRRGRRLGTSEPETEAHDHVPERRLPGLPRLPQPLRRDRPRAQVVAVQTARHEAAVQHAGLVDVQRGMAALARQVGTDQEKDRGRDEATRGQLRTRSAPCRAGPSQRSSETASGWKPSLIRVLTYAMRVGSAPASVTSSIAPSRELSS